MANEAVLVFETENAIPMIVSNSSGIEKGTVCKMADPFTASASVASGDIVAGIAKCEKIANDGKTSLSIYRRGIFKMIASGSITVGDAVATACSGDDANKVRTAVAGDVGAKTLGIALETATTGQSLLVELNVGCNNKAYS